MTKEINGFERKTARDANLLNSVNALIFCPKALAIALNCFDCFGSSVHFFGTSSESHREVSLQTEACMLSNHPTVDFREHVMDLGSGIYQE